jgi:hypothetical protein
MANVLEYQSGPDDGSPRQIKISDIDPIIEMGLSDFEYDPTYYHNYYPPQYKYRRFKDREAVVVEGDKYLCACYKCKAIYLFDNSPENIGKIKFISSSQMDNLGASVNLTARGNYPDTAIESRETAINEDTVSIVPFLPEEIQIKILEDSVKTLIGYPEYGVGGNFYRVLDYIDDEDELNIFNKRFGKTRRTAFRRAYNLEMKIIYNNFLEIIHSDRDEKEKQEEISNLYLIAFYIFNATPRQLRMAYEIEKYLNQLEDNVHIRYLASNSNTPINILEEIAEIGGYEEQLILNESFPINSVVKLNLFSISKENIELICKDFFDVDLRLYNCCTNSAIGHSLFALRRLLRDLTYEEWVTHILPFGKYDSVILKRGSILCNNPPNDIDRKILDHILDSLILNNNAQYLWVVRPNSVRSNNIQAALSEEHKAMLFLNKEQHKKALEELP